MSLKDDDSRESHKQYYLPTMETKYYNVMVDGRNFFYHPRKNDLKTYNNIRKTATGQGDDYTTGCWLYYRLPLFQKNYELISIDLSKKQKLDADPKAMQQINSAGNLDRAEGSTMFFVIEESKKKNSYSIMILFCFNIILI